MIVFDASVLIAYLDGNDDLHAEAEVGERLFEQGGPLAQHLVLVEPETLEHLVSNEPPQDGNAQQIEVARSRPGRSDLGDGSRRGRRREPF